MLWGRIIIYKTKVTNDIIVLMDLIFHLKIWQISVVSKYKSDCIKYTCINNSLTNVFKLVSSFLVEIQNNSFFFCFLCFFQCLD